MTAAVKPKPGKQQETKFMKTPAILLMTLILVSTSISAIGTGTNEPVCKAPSQATASVPTPEFDALLVRLQNCGGLIPALTQWLRVLKPSLQGLGYSAEEIKLIRVGLTKNTVALEDARRFSERWLAKHNEHVSASDIYQFLRRDKSSAQPVEVAAK